MAIQVAIRHHTKYKYDRAVKLSPQTIRLRPAPHARNPIRGYSLRIQPADHFINWQQDPFGNYLARVTIPDPTTEFVIDVEVITDMVVINPFDFFLEEYASRFPFTYDASLGKELEPYLEAEEAGPLLAQWLAKAQDLRGQNTVDFLVALNQRLAGDIDYNVRMEPGVQSCEETLDIARGSCRDSAWLLVQILRHFGLAARFVSGYLVQLTADEKPLEGPAGTEVDFTDLHAWAEVYLPGAGWVGLDATSGLFAGEGHIPLACTPSPGAAAAITGYSEPCQSTFEFANRVDRIRETPRVTKPYTPDQWSAMLALGDRVDEALTAGDVRLTMGGEPTFVSAEDMESPEWNEAADGDQKRRMAYELAQRLWGEFGPGGLIHEGQGKWYPGEALPRWQYAIYWRKDGLPLWEQPESLADPRQEYPVDEDRAEAFGRRLAELLGVDPGHCLPAYEDIFYFLWEEGNLPVNIDPLRIDPKDKAERRTLAELLDRGLDRPKGFVLPLRHDHRAAQWESCEWSFSRGHLFLLPGNSPIGLRLPLDRLPRMVEEQEEVVVPASPLEDHPPLAQRSDITARIDRRTGARRVMDPGVPEPVKPSEEFEPEYRVRITKTALCFEPRDGRLFVFLPPLDDAESFIDLIATLERAAADLDLPIVIEGYHPPADPRLEKLVVAPDPGVVEVNVHPAKSWREIVHNYDTLFKMARASRLGTNKFMLDGKHTGTGGGNHITLGGVVPAESPLLRRPDLLRSFVNFWQNHPGLSYLFSSAFVGPTSQAPRVDEGRPDRLYELKIAFRELDRHDNPPPWLVDRLFRHLLTDLTGNTHRAEFCIDKLYSPDSSSGRLGILEMRGFDMPPHREMCLAQLLLIRCLVAAFWQRPYRRPLVHWGNDLHDRFLLHHFVREDLKSVLLYLEEAGFPFDPAWLEPFFEFRFPQLGQVRIGEVGLTVRAAIEPWIVLGEEMTSTGTARYVDSSVERIEVHLEGLNRDRYQLLCNRTVVPLLPAGRNGSYVAGIRYKAWNPPSALHPTVGVDVPLVFDIYDSWNERSIGGCTYHVSHPGGRSYDTFPVNSFEAEARRVNRFWEHNHTPRATEQIVTQANVAPDTEPARYVRADYTPEAAFTVRRVEVDNDFPSTLDLRRVDKTT